MRAVIQRVARASVHVDGERVGAIERGLLVLLGVAPEDSPADRAALAQKLVHLRIFENEAGKMDQSVLDTGGSILLVSQFTLLADLRKGRRPSFTGAAPPSVAEQTYEAMAAELAELGVPVETGRFGANMSVELLNDGPVTLILDSSELVRS